MMPRRMTVISSGARLRHAENQKQAILESAKKDITEMVENATRKVVLSGNTSEAYDMFLDNAERSDS